ncbi:hypothetical protein LINPERHAP2_LOCUS6156 [Linum perenne]
MSRKLPQLWAKKGAVRVSDVGFGFYIVNFETISDYDRAMFGGPWMVNDHYVVIQEWRPYFQPEETFLSTLRVWVRLPGIPFEYFDNTILKLIGDRIGKTVRIDHTTLEGTRGNFARICVEVDLSKPLLSKYRLRRRVRRIEYEGLHTICFNCGCYGHKDEACQQIPEAEVTENQTTNFVNPVFQSVAEQEARPEIDENFGPWMQVKRNRRKQKPVVSPVVSPVAAGSSAVRPEEGESGKGNRFSIFADKEGIDQVAPMPPPSKARPLGFDVNEPLIEDLQEVEKENYDPNSEVSPLVIPSDAPSPANPPVGLGVSASNDSGLGLSAKSSPPSSSPVMTSPLLSQPGSVAQGPFFKPPPTKPQQSILTNPSAAVPVASQKKNGAAPKVPKATKPKSKGNASSASAKTKVPMPSEGVSDGVAAMEEQ